MALLLFTAGQDRLSIGGSRGGGPAGAGLAGGGLGMAAMMGEGVG
jgi:hypothetical protein